VESLFLQEDDLGLPKYQKYYKYIKIKIKIKILKIISIIIYKT